LAAPDDGLPFDLNPYHRRLKERGHYKGMTKMQVKINNQTQAKRQTDYGWFSHWAVVLVGLMALAGCSKKSANPSAGTVVKNSSGMEFAYIPAGSFQMGSANADPNEQPVHQVTFASGFYLGLMKSLKRSGKR